MYNSRYPHPFTTTVWDIADEYRRDLSTPDTGDRDTPRTLLELQMCALSATIREKTDWVVKFCDPDIQSKWRREIAEQQVDEHESRKLTDNMINYVMTELEAYAAMRDPDTGIEMGPYERTWKSDSLIPDSLKCALMNAISPLECVSDDQKDWHPGSNNQVLDLVHPSLYPVAYGRTASRTGALLKPLHHGLNKHSEFTSTKFQWLPSDFDVDEEGSVRLASPYINNVRPDAHAPLVHVITQLVARAVPMWERVLSDLARETRLQTRMDLKGKVFPACVWRDRKPYVPDDMPDELLDKIESLYAADHARRAAGERVPRVDYEAQFAPEWLATLPKQWPDSKPAYDGGLDDVKKTVDLRGRQLQVIVKLANIMLTPDKPEYSGGTWHVEGMNNEAIVTTFIYYYDCTNVTESTLSFRTAVCRPRPHVQDDDFCMENLYGIKRKDPCVQEIGSVLTCQDRCIAFPNIYQHCVSSFRLVDPSKVGHRKIAVLFLVDPHVRIPSASTVGIQRADWLRAAVAGTTLWERLPVELRDEVWRYLDLIEKDEAEALRLQLMRERTRNVQSGERERFGVPFSMCEH